MKYILDHDIHLHSKFSPCSNDARHTVESILSYGVTRDYRLLVLTDHAWDNDIDVPHRGWVGAGATWQNLKSMAPLPQAKGTHFMLGIEVDINMDGVRAIDRAGEEEADFIIYAPSHLHMKNFTIPADFPEDAETHAARYKERLHDLLNDDSIPFEKTGLAHFTCGLACTKEPIRVFSLFSDAEYRDIFTKVARRGMGVELNFNPYSYNEADLAEMLRPYRIAKEVGCKFYCGSDAHHPENFRTSHNYLTHLIGLLGLEESDKFPFIADRIARMDAGEQFLGNRKKSV